MSFLAKSMFLTPLIARSAANFLEQIAEAYDTGVGLQIDTKFFDKPISFSAKDRVSLYARDEDGQPIVEFIRALDSRTPKCFVNKILYKTDRCTLSRVYLNAGDELISTPQWRLSTRRTVSTKVLDKDYMPELGREYLREYVQVRTPQLYHLEVRGDLITRPRFNKTWTTWGNPIVAEAKTGTYSQAWDVEIMEYEPSSLSWDPATRSQTESTYRHSSLESAEPHEDSVARSQTGTKYCHSELEHAQPEDLHLGDSAATGSGSYELNVEEADLGDSAARSQTGSGSHEPNEEEAAKALKAFTGN